VSEALLKSAPLGSKVQWSEYAAGEAEPTSGTIMSANASSRAVTIRCTSPSCTISDVLYVPPLRPGPRVARFAEAYSPLLRTPGNAHQPPTKVSGDWASVYSPAPRDYPSSVYDPAAWQRWLGLAIGYLMLVLGCVAAYEPRR
jgi:hypothetical protein